MSNSLGHQGGFIERVLSDVHVAQPFLEGIDDDTGQKDGEYVAMDQTVQRHPFEAAVQHLSSALANTGGALQLLDGSIASIDRMLRIRSRGNAPPQFVPVACVQREDNKSQSALDDHLKLFSRQTALRAAADSIACARDRIIQKVAASRRQHRAVADAVGKIQRITLNLQSANRRLPWVGMLSGSQIERALHARAGALGLWLLRGDCDMEKALQFADVGDFQLARAASRVDTASAGAAAKRHRVEDLRAGGVRGSDDAGSVIQQRRAWHRDMKWPPLAALQMPMGNLTGVVSIGEGSSTLGDRHRDSHEGVGVGGGGEGGGSGQAVPAVVCLELESKCSAATHALFPASVRFAPPSRVCPMASTMFVVTSKQSLSQGSSSQPIARAGTDTEAVGSGEKEKHVPANSTSTTDKSGSDGVDERVVEPDTELRAFGPLDALGASEAPLVLSATVLVRDGALDSNPWLTGDRHAARGEGVEGPVRASPAVREAMRLRRPVGWKVAARAEMHPVSDGIGTGRGGTFAPGIERQASYIAQSLTAIESWMQCVASIVQFSQGEGLDDMGGDGGNDSAVRMADGSHAGSASPDMPPAGSTSPDIPQVGSPLPFSISHAGNLNGFGIRMRSTTKVGDVAAAGASSGRANQLDMIRSLAVDAFAGSYDTCVVEWLRAELAAGSNDTQPGDRKGTDEPATQHATTAPQQQAPAPMALAALAAVHRLSPWRFIRVPVVQDGSVVVLVGIDRQLAQGSVSAAGPRIVHSVGGIASAVGRSAAETFAQLGARSDASKSGFMALCLLRRVAIAGLISAAAGRAGRSVKGLDAVEAGEAKECKLGPSADGGGPIAVTVGATSPNSADLSNMGDSRLNISSDTLLLAGPPRMLLSVGGDTNKSKDCGVQRTEYELLQTALM